MKKQILVLGSTGTVGRRLVEILRRSDHAVRLASRSAMPRFDWADRSTWEPILTGVSRLYLLTPHGVPVDVDFVELAVAQGVEHIVLQSSGGIEVMGDERLITAERIVRESGVAWTILRPNWFNQNFDEGFFREAIQAGEVAVPVGAVRQAFVDASDIAAVAATTLTQDGHAEKSYEVTGPEALSFAEVIDTISRAAGYRVRFDGTPEGYQAAQQQIGRAPAEIAGEIAAFSALAEAGDAVPTEVVKQLTGRPAIAFATYATQAAAQGAWRRQ